MVYYVNKLLQNFIFGRNNILWGILFGPEALQEFREDIMLAISSLSVGCRNIVHFHLKDSPTNVYVNILCFFFIVSAIEAK